MCKSMQNIKSGGNIVHFFCRKQLCYELTLATLYEGFPQLAKLRRTDMSNNLYLISIYYTPDLCGGFVTWGILLEM